VDPDQVRELMTGIAAGCRIAGAAIVGGELAEHPGLLAPGEVDMAGFAVGIVEHDRIIDGPSRARAGDALLGLPSPGLRSNGYSLARRALLEVAGRRLDGPAWPGADTTLADELLRPSVIYAPAVVTLLSDPGPGSDADPAGHLLPDAARPVEVHAIAHITGGGLPGNLPRVLPSDVDAVVDPARWIPPRIFREVQAVGSVSDAEMRRVFNLGIGMVVVLPPDDVPDAIDLLAGAGHEPLVIGQLEAGSGQVRYLD
jgi:phosphoribosylformylglycinamidine cyclo-ligase